MFNDFTKAGGFWTLIGDGCDLFGIKLNHVAWYLSIVKPIWRFYVFIENIRQIALTNGLQKQQHTVCQHYAVFYFPPIVQISLVHSLISFLFSQWELFIFCNQTVLIWRFLTCVSKGLLIYIGLKMIATVSAFCFDKSVEKFTLNVLCEVLNVIIISNLKAHFMKENFSRKV